MDSDEEEEEEEEEEEMEVSDDEESEAAAEEEGGSSGGGGGGGKGGDGDEDAILDAAVRKIVAASDVNTITIKAILAALATELVRGVDGLGWRVGWVGGGGVVCVRSVGTDACVLPSLDSTHTQHPQGRDCSEEKPKVKAIVTEILSG